jgi:CBS domain-containing protein
MATAKKIMTPDPITLDSSTPIQDAIKLFAEKKISSVPVFSTTGDGVGLLTEFVLLRALVMSQVQPAKFSKIAHCLDMLEPVQFVTPDDSITTVLATMMKSTHRRVLVRSGGRKIHGIISPKDLLRSLSSGTEEAKSIQAAVEKLG